MTAKCLSLFVFYLQLMKTQMFIISGYRMKIDDKEDKANTGRLHIDFAQARDDLHEWECAQRQLVRESRHRERVEGAMLGPPSPPAIVHYSDHEAMMLIDALKGESPPAIVYFSDREAEARRKEFMLINALKCKSCWSTFSSSFS